MRYVFIILLLMIVICSCRKKDNKNNTNDSNNSQFTHTITRSFILFDSTYRWHSNASGDTTISTLYSLNRQIATIFDTVANYIVAEGDTFRYNNTYPLYAGYFSYYSNPADCDQMIVTDDSVKIYYSRYIGGHQYVSRIVRGYKK